MTNLFIIATREYILEKSKELSPEIRDFSNEDKSFVKNIKSLPGVSKLKRDGDIETFEKENDGILYGIKYFADGLIIRINADSPSFKSIHSVDLINLNGVPKYTIYGLNVMSKDDLLKSLGGLFQDSKSRAIMMSEGFANKVAEKILNWMATPIGQIITTLSPILLGVIVTGGYYGIKAINSVKERMLFASGELKRDEAMFSGQTENDNAFKMYENTVQHLKMLIDNEANGVILAGPPGTSKTYIVRRTLYFSGLKHGPDYKIENGAALSADAFYSMLYENRNKILVLDDFDSPLLDPDMTNMLKAITDTSARRILSYPQPKVFTQQDSDSTLSLPKKFEFTGRLIMITNLPPNKIDPALRTRAPLHYMNFNAKQVIDSMDKMLIHVKPGVDIKLKQEVLDYIKQLYSRNKNIQFNFRNFVHSIETRQRAETRSLDWKSLVKNIVNP
jgi:hypothetical protein